MKSGVFIRCRAAFFFFYSFFSVLLLNPKRPLDGDLESSDFMRSSGSLFGFICAENRPLTWFL